MDEISPTDLAWLAGLLEGEGCFSLDRGIYPRIYLNMTDADVVTKAQSIAGVGALRGPKHYGPNRKPVYSWQVNYEAVELMTILWPHMGPRRQARIDEVLQRYAERSVKRKHWKSGAWRKEQNDLASLGAKRCVRCMTVKPLADYYEDRRAGSPRGHCIACH